MRARGRSSVSMGMTSLTSRNKASNGKNIVDQALLAAENQLDEQSLHEHRMVTRKYAFEIFDPRHCFIGGNSGGHATSEEQ